MLKNVYILHGCCDKEEYFSQQYPSPSNSHWIPWLQKQLCMRSYNGQALEMPLPFDPQYDQWKSVFEGHRVTSETILVAHSCGCGFFLRWLGENKHTIKALILVAPWLDSKRASGSFLEFSLSGDLKDRVDQIHVLYSSDDPVEGVKDSVDLILETYPEARLHAFGDKGHFCLEEMKTDRFPEILDIIEEIT